MATAIENRWELGGILGSGIAPFRIMLDDLERFFGRPGLELDDGARDDLAAWFQPAEDNPGQHRQAAERRAFAAAWALEHGDTLPEWLELAGVTLEDAPAPAK